jgi:UDP-GlcNAc:undecaprenyl-phosphate GlcNAc-1-phosphate transferase
LAYVLTLAVSLFVAMALIPPLARVAGRLGLEDIPDARKVHVRPIPRVGGIAIIVGMASAVILWVPMQPWILGYLCGAAVIGAFGVWDDRCDLDYRLKFLGQFLAAAIAIGIGDIRIAHLPFFEAWTLPAHLSIPLTLLVLVAITNAINLTDGLDGLAGGTTLLAVSCMALLAFLDQDETLVIISLGLIGALFGFLRYNSYPARVFLGDTGSQFLGFSAAVLAIVLTQDSNTALSPALPLLLLGLPILDTLVVMTQRIVEGRSPFKPDRSHLHHRLLSIGLDHYEAVLLIYVIQTALICAAFFLRYERDSLLIALYLALALAIVVPLTLFRRYEWSLRNRQLPQPSLATLVARVGRHPAFRQGPMHVVGVIVVALLLGSALACSHVTTDLGLAALACLAFFAARLVLPRVVAGVFDRLAVYVTAAFAVFLLATTATLPDLFGYSPLPFVYALLAVAVAFAVRFSDAGRFTVSSLDFLVIVLVVLLTIVADVAEGDPIYVKIALQLLIVFYACEMLLFRAAFYWWSVRLASVVALAVFASRALIT